MVPANSVRNLSPHHAVATGDQNCVLSLPERVPGKRVAHPYQRSLRPNEVRGQVNTRQSGNGNDCFPLLIRQTDAPKRFSPHRQILSALIDTFCQPILC
jgi:hypothetical protein